MTKPNSSSWYGRCHRSGSTRCWPSISPPFFAALRQVPRNFWRWSGCMATQLCSSQQQTLVQPFLAKEVRSAIQGFNGDGALGVDGLPVFFNRDCWDVVGTKVTTDVELFCRGGAKHGVDQPLTHRPHSQTSRGSGYWAFLTDLPIQLTVPDPDKVLGEPVA